jgi:hypothetical protein
MQQVRRVTSLVALLAVGALTLAGCRSDPTVAAYVGSTHYSENRVTAIADEADAKLRDLAEQSGAPQPDKRPVSEQQVVTALVSRDVLKALAQAKKVSPLNLTADQVAQQVQVPADTEYVRVLAEKDSYRLALLQQAPSAEPSDAVLREVYDNLVNLRTGQFSGSFEQFKSTLAEQDTELVGRSAAVRKDISDEAEKLDVTVNPKFGPAVLSLVDISDQQGGVHSLLGVPLNATQSGVKDLS